MNLKIKNTITICCFFLFIHHAKAQQGVFAGSHKKWLQKEIVKAEENKFFKGCTYGGGMLLQDDVERELWLSHYLKGSTHIIIFYTQIKDALSYTIQDVLEIKDMKKGMNIQLGTCQRGGEYNNSLIGLTKNRTHLKAWWVDKDKLKIIKTSAKGINCFIED